MSPLFEVLIQAQETEWHQWSQNYNKLFYCWKMKLFCWSRDSNSVPLTASTEPSRGDLEEVMTTTSPSMIAVFTLK